MNNTNKFQSLFYWILFLRQSRKMPTLNTTKVSILVLLDFVLKVLEELEEVISIN